MLVYKVLCEHTFNIFIENTPGSGIDKLQGNSIVEFFEELSDFPRWMHHFTFLPMCEVFR